MRPPRRERICTAFSTDCSAYLGWQSLLLARTHGKAGQTGGLVRLVAGGRDGFPFASACVAIPTSAPDLARHYAPYNKPHSILDWMRSGGPEEELVLLLDPDCIWLRPLRATALPGAPVAQRIGYMDPARHRDLIGRHCAAAERVQPVGFPVVIHREDLARIAEGWCRKTREILGHPGSREQAGWVAEMWAYCFAAAEAGLEHRLDELAVFANDDRADAPLVHYCYAVSGPNGWHFDKRSYEPWSAVRTPTPGGPRAAVVLVNELNELAAKMRAVSRGSVVRPRRVPPQWPAWIRRLRPRQT